MTEYKSAVERLAEIRKRTEGSIDAQYIKKYLERGTPYRPTEKSTSITDEVVKEKQLKNKEKEQDIKLKRKTLYMLFCFLGIETIIVFIITFFQGFSFRDFRMDEWSFKLLLGATIIQISYMLRIAIKHLFPS